jgi:hypothetical protein
MSVSEIIDKPGEDHSKETLNRAFRLNKNALDALHQEARERNMTVNTIVNEMVMKHVTVDRTIKHHHPVIIASSVFRQFSEALSEDRVIKIAEEAANDILIGDFPVEIAGDDSAAGILLALKLFSLAGEYEYSEEEFGGNKTVILIHDVDKNWSLFTATFWKTKLNHKGVEVKISTTDKAAVLQFRQSDIHAVNHPTP